MGKRWSADEDAFLRANWQCLKTEEITETLGRAVSGVQHRAVRLHLPKGRFWTKEEDDYLTKNWQKIGTTIIAEKTERDVRGVQKRARRLHLGDGRVKWDEAQDAVLRSNWGSLTVPEIAEILHRDIQTVYQRAFIFKLGRGKREHGILSGSVAAKRAGIARRTGQFIPCGNCGKIIYRCKSDLNRPNFCSHTCRAAVLKPSGETIRKALLANKLKPNKLEILLNALLEKHFPGEYSFNGDLSLGVMLGGLVPDFVNVNGKKRVIELFGDYWHDKKKNIPWKSTEFGRQAVFSQLGFKLLVIWEHELKSPEEVIEKIRSFNE